MKGVNLAMFLGGMLVGGIVALLYAPESGEQTRKHIKNFVDKRVEGIKENYSELTEKIKRSYGAEPEHHKVESVEG